MSSTIEVENTSPAYLLESQPVVSLAELERRAILHALVHANGRLVLAARLLGIGRTTIYKKVKMYRLEQEAVNNAANDYALSPF